MPPPYPRAARAAGDVSFLQGEERGVDDEPIATYAARQGIQHTPSNPMHKHAYHPPFFPTMPHQIQTGIMSNLHLGNTMHSLPSLHRDARGGPRHHGCMNHDHYYVINTFIIVLNCVMNYMCEIWFEKCTKSKC